MGDRTQHFSNSEFVDRRTSRLLEPPCRLLGVLEAIRAQAGRPIRIVSGYRTPETNELVGGAANSRHIHGDAADIEPGVCTLEQAERAGAVGIGTKGQWVIHVDVRPGGPARWSY